MTKSGSLDKPNQWLINCPLQRLSMIELRSVNPLDSIRLIVSSESHRLPASPATTTGESTVRNVNKSFSPLSSSQVLAMRFYLIFRPVMRSSIFVVSERCVLSLIYPSFLFFHPLSVLYQQPDRFDHLRPASFGISV